MNKTLLRMKQEAKSLVAEQEMPGFYQACAPELDFSRTSFFDHPLIHRLREDVIPFLYDDYGHGIDHSKKVAIEGGAIVLVEMKGGNMTRARHLALLAQMAGLLHDICRLEEDHAARGAELSETILLDYPLEKEDKERIAFAIADHEAFSNRKQTEDPEALLLSKALYDADKFRWGPDNFATTLWEMCDYNDIPVQEILDRFPSGVKKIEEVASTFRTSVGQTFGPQFIELGLSLGRDIHERLIQVIQEDQD
ncbi:HD domain-containing protein [Desulfovibrio ferrophilus]|uniref:HD domain-containing protein n=1 Tax=Desulfovibrio ferrophilus TaxID=241368 RepID=A0A2Z6AXC7_9BACT|nr:HD domain-containing protein [Desulfovibrio ferrophilus]BBD07870.1 uncharacterized protein DFE_1144 [Desulfovibrio ferrophilus]